MIKTRSIEMLVAETTGDSHGTWWTEYVDIPADTPETNIEEVAAKWWWKNYKRLGREIAVAGLMVYWIPEEGETEVEEPETGNE